MLATLHLSSALDAELRGALAGNSRAGASHSAFHALLRSYAFVPAPLFPEGGGNSASGIWHVQLPEQDGQNIIAQFLRLTGVEAAYAKAAEGAPNPDLSP